VPRALPRSPGRLSVCYEQHVRRLKDGDNSNEEADCHANRAYALRAARLQHMLDLMSVQAQVICVHNGHMLPSDGILVHHVMRHEWQRP